LVQQADQTCERGCVVIPLEELTDVFGDRRRVETWS
jgi:hypothetical protein